MNFAINYWAVLVAAVAAMITGFLWYGPIFGKLWMSLMGITPEKMKESQAKGGMGARYFAMFIGSLVVSYALAYLVHRLGIMGIEGACKLTLYVGIGFIATVLLGSVLWEERPIKLYVLNVAYYLVSIFIQTLILAYWW